MLKRNGGKTGHPPFQPCIFRWWRHRWNDGSYARAVYATRRARQGQLRSGADNGGFCSPIEKAFLNSLLKVCKNTCRLASPSACFARSANASGINEARAPQSEFRGLHVLRASIRDQEGKRYVFVLQDTEAWKVAIGLQRLRAGALVRNLGVTALSIPDCKSVLGGLGYV